MKIHYILHENVIVLFKGRKMNETAAYKHWKHEINGILSIFSGTTKI